MSEVLDRIRRELQERLESTRAAAREHECVRAALEAPEALEHATRPLEKAARQAASGASRRGRTLAAGARPASGREGSAAAESDIQPATSARPTSARQRRAPRAPRSSGGRPASRPPAKRAAAASKPRTRATSGKPAQTRAPRGANRAAVLAVVRERPGVPTSELAAASGVTGGTLYALLRRLTEQGELARRELPGGHTGYAIDGSEAGPTNAVESEGAGVRRSPSHPRSHRAQRRPTSRELAAPRRTPRPRRRTTR
jgi:hypothetical protein